MHPHEELGSFSPASNHVILVVGLTTATMSLAAALVAFQWFAFMKRSFRHHLIFLLILSDMFKAFWYFIFPIVVFTRGTVQSSSKFCQASGFLLALGTEASDYAILMIAIHAALYVFRPPDRLGEGGLYPYRWWMYTFWVILPILAASLGFTSPNGYVTAGTFCNLPKRPFWYRLALSYIPRYLIFITIFVLYAAISIYVHVKFRGFSHFNDGGSSDHTESQGSTLAPNKQLDSLDSSYNMDSRKPSAALGSVPQVHFQQDLPEWENANFITTAPSKEMNSRQASGVAAADFAAANSDSSSVTRGGPVQNPPTLSFHDPFCSDPQRKESEVPTLGTDFTGETRTTGVPKARPTDTAPTSQLSSTRQAILRQLRFLFIYPAVYLLMWMFPFASHCLQYSDYYAAHPPFWLTIIVTCSLALQAFADCVVFSWREKPWRRIRSGAPLSVRKLNNIKSWTFIHGHARHEIGAGGGVGGGESPPHLKNQTVRDFNWWEAEGRKRKDSVWLGTDTMQTIVSRQEQEEAEEQAEASKDSAKD